MWYRKGIEMVCPYCWKNECGCQEKQKMIDYINDLFEYHFHEQLMIELSKSKRR